MSPHAQEQLPTRSKSPQFHVTKLSDILAAEDTSAIFGTRSRMPASGSGDVPVQSRRTHTKSRKGCKTCKKRHIRCDETTPQCRNCTKHNVRCDYMDGALAEGVPDLAITPQIQRELDAWKNTGNFPFPSLGLQSPSVPVGFNPTDLRLLHHISAIAAQMQAADSPYKYAIWTRRVPMFLRLATNNDFVMHSLLGFSASHLSWLTASGPTQQLAYQHRGIAFQGLQRAIGSFSKENSDAVLAASILLSWQVTDWRSWASLLQGTTTVIDAMHSWKYESEFAEFMEEGESYTRGALRTQLVNPARDLQVVNHVYSFLLPLRKYFEGREEELKGVEDLIYFIQGLHDKIKVSVQSADEQFALLHPLRTWLFFLPIDYLRRERYDVGAMVLLAHLFGVALAVEPLFPDVGVAFFGTMSVAPIEHIHRTLSHQSVSNPSPEVHTALSMMAFPLEMVHEFRERMAYRRMDYAPPVHSSHLSTLDANACFDFDAFPEFTMVNNPQGVGAPPANTALAQDVHGSFAATDLLASAMWRTE